MYQKALWCYIFILTLLDISLNTKLTAQGESHGVTIHESLVEGITFQEWGKETSIDGIDGIEGDSENVEGLSLEPRTLKFGRSALATPHSRTVTVTNTANTTLHLASVAGTTPDFHASFFESKTLPPQGNTTFSVVYLGRREGPVHAHLYIHTSLGVHKYRVSAVGVASPYGVWPLLGVRVPANASVEPELRLHNPTDTTVQVREVYSTGAWLRLRLPGGGARAHRDLWAVPPRSSRTLVLLHLAPAALHQPLVAYVRVRADVPGGGLVLAVEARAVAAGEHARPLHVRLGARGLCANARALHGLAECRGHCDSGTLYNNQTGQHASACECCTATGYAWLAATLQCADGSTALHRVRTPAHCACRACGAAAYVNNGYSPSERPPYGMEPDDFAIPSIFARTGRPLPGERPQEF